MLANCRSLSVNKRSPASSRQGNKLRGKVPTIHDTAFPSFMDASFCVAGLTQPHLSAESAHEAYFFGKNLLRMSFAKGSHDTAFLSFMDASLCELGLTQPHLSTKSAHEANFLKISLTK
jgi:hypothetical protein